MTQIKRSASTGLLARPAAVLAKSYPLLEPPYPPTSLQKKPKRWLMQVTAKSASNALLDVAGGEIL